MQKSIRSTLNRMQCVARPVKADLKQEAQKLLAGCAASVIVAAPALAGSVSFPNVTDGATLGTPAALEFSVAGMDVLPANQGLVEGTGHFHLLIDVANDFPAGEAIPFTPAHVHFGKGQTSTTVELAPGKHKLSLQFANALHQSYGPEYMKTIQVYVK